MFKSVFTKYIVSFTLLIGISFALLVLTVSSMLSNYSVETKKAIMSRTAESVASSIETYHQLTENIGIDELISFYNTQITTDLDGYSAISECAIYIVSSDGTLLASSESQPSPGETLIPAETVQAIINAADTYTLSKLDGTFDATRLNVFKNISVNGTVTAFILVSSGNARDDLLAKTMISTIITASLWIFLASLIIVYILSQRIIYPLKQLSAAAKSFAKGDFKTRVNVGGHDEVAELASAFNNMASVLEKNEETRNSFLANVAHDLRTPMTVISGFVDGIRDGTIPPEKHDYYLEVISTEVRRLSRLVNSLLELSRMQSGDRKLNITLFNISEKARQVLLSFEKKIDEKHLNIEFENNDDEDVFVSADTDAIHQVLYNLIDNAVKFTPQNGTLAISIQTESKKAVIKVRNSGDGIPAEEIPYLFDRFYKSDRSRGLDKTGTGLGLYIARSNINMHGEEITVTSEVGKFTEFTFRLPL